MAIFDDLFGAEKQVINPEAEIIGRRSVDDVDNEPGFFDQLFSDQNFIRGLGEAGASISSGAPIGEFVGNFASNLTRRRAVQKAANQTRNERKTFQEQLLDAVRSGQALSPTADNNAFDSFQMDGDGGIKLSMKNTPQQLGFRRNQPLESMRNSSVGGTDLPDFSNQPSEGSIDFAGLDADDIGMLLNAEQRFGQLSQNDAKILLAEKNRRQDIIAANKARAEDLKNLASQQKESKRRFDLERKDKAEEKETARSFRMLELTSMKNNQLELINERDRLAKLDKELITPDEQARIDKLNSDIKVNDARIKKMDQETKILDQGKGTTALQQAQIDKINSDLVRKEDELGLKFDTLEKDELFSVQPVLVDDKGDEVKVPFEEREANAQQANNRPNNKVFYWIKPPVEDAPNIHRWGTDIPGEITPVFLPKHPKTGKQITALDVLDTARANKVSPEEVLKQWGLIK